MEVPVLSCVVTAVAVAVRGYIPWVDEWQWQEVWAGFGGVCVLVNTVFVFGGGSSVVAQVFVRGQGSFS